MPSLATKPCTSNRLELLQLNHIISMNWYDTGFISFQSLQASPFSGYYFNFQMFLTQVAKNGTIQSKSKRPSSFFVLFCGEYWQSVKQLSTNCTKSTIVQYEYRTSTSPYEYQQQSQSTRSRISTKVQIKLEIKTTSICILNRSGIIPVYFEGKIWSNFIG